MSRCKICGAPFEESKSACSYAVPEAHAPWRGDYSAMSRGEMTHAEHQIQVARWALHNESAHSAKSLAVLRAIAQTHAGQVVKTFEVAAGHGSV